MKKRIIAVLLAFCLVVGLLPGRAGATNGALTGEGTEASPYLIYDAADLAAFRDKVNGDEPGAWAKLMNNIVLNPAEYFDEDGTVNAAAVQWTPIGNSDSDKKYSGTFDGNGKTVSGLYINSSLVTDFDLGLFGFIDKAGKIKDLTITGSVTGGYRVGGVCGYNRGTIMNCTNTGAVTNTSNNSYVYAGGMCGQNEGTITNCTNTGTVTNASYESYSYAGGMSGDNEGTITNCINTGAVIGNGHVGGVCGANYRKGTSTNCYFLQTEMVNKDISGIGNDEGTAEGKNDAAFASGEVCWLLNGGENQADPLVWYQTIGVDAVPVLSGTDNNAVYKVSFTGCVGEGYSNTSGSQAREHIWTYSADGATLTATCGNDSSHTAAITLIAPTGDTLKYTGNAIVPTISDENKTAWEDLGLLVPTIKYTYGDQTDTTAAPINAGSVTAKITMGTGSDAKTATATYTIAKAEHATITSSRSEPENKAQTGVTFDFATALSGIDGAVISAPTYQENTDGVLTGTPTVSGTVVTFDVASVAAGKSGKIEVTVNSTNYEPFKATLTVTTVSKSEATVTLGTVPASKTYGDSAFTITATAADEGTNGAWTWRSLNESVLTVTSAGVVTIVGAGSAAITAEYSSDTTLGSAAATITVNKATVTVAAGSYKVGKTYDGTTTAGTGSGELSVSGILSADTGVAVTPGIPAFGNANAGAGELTVTLALSGTGSDNYQLASASLSVPCEITRKPITPTVENIVAVDYDGTAKTPAVTVKDGDTTLAATDYEATYSNNTNAGTATATIKAKSTGNYSFSDTVKNFTINKVAYPGPAVTASKEVLVSNAETGVEVDFTRLIKGITGAAVASASEGTDSDDLISNVTTDGNKVKFDVASVADVDRSATINVTVSSTNYTDFTAVLTVTTAAGIAAPTYTVSFEANGGSGTMEDVAGVSDEYTLPECGFTAPEGKQFKCWSVGGEEKAAGDTITVSADITITAVWEDIPTATYTVSFDAGSGSGTMDDVAGVSGSYTLPACTFTAPDGKQFKCWSVGGEKKAVGDTITVGEDTTVTAVWEDIPTAAYTVSFEAGSGSGTMDDVAGVSGSYTLPACTFTAPDGKQFKCWSVGGEEKAVGDTITVSADITVTAIWEEIPATCTVRFDANGGSGTMADVSVVSGSYVLPACAFTAPDGKQFKCWKVGSVEKAAGASITVGVDITITAVWEDIPVADTVTFDPNGGTLPEGEPATRKVIKNDKYGALPVPTREGYLFEGWYTAAEDGIRVEATTVVTATEDHTLYAHWKAIPAEATLYTVTFDPNDGALPEGASTTRSVIKNDKYGALPTPTRAGYTFAGWFTAKSGGSKVTETTAVKLTKDQTLYAHWTAAKFTLTLNANGGTFVKNGDLKTVSVTFGKNYTGLANPTRKEGNREYSFDGWYRDDSDGRRITTADRMDVAADHTLYAHWTEITVLNTAKLTDPKPLVYDGKAQKPPVKVYGVDDALLTEGVDYTVKYSNNTAANWITSVEEGGNGVDSWKNAKKKPTITITGKGNYTGKIDVCFEIKPCPLAGAEAADVYLAYNKKVQKGSPAVKLNGKTLKKGTDYTLTYPSAGDYKTAGSYDIVITGKGNYTGTITVRQIITESTLMSKVKVEIIPPEKLDPPQTFDGAAYVPTLKLTAPNKSLLNVGADYTLESCSKDIPAGTVTVTLRGAGTYAGVVTKTLPLPGTKLKAANVKPTAKIAFDPNYRSENAKASGLSVTIAGLTEGTDYEVIWPESIKKGTNKVTVVGKGQYVGSVTKNFTVTAYAVKQDDANVTIGLPDGGTRPYAKGGAKFEPEAITVKAGSVTLKLGADYTISYANNTAVNGKKTPTVKISFKGNYSGSKTQTFQITRQDLDALEMAAPDIAYTNKKGKFTTSVVLTDLDGKALKAGTDYELKYYRGSELLGNDSIVAVGETLTVVATAKDGGNYSGSKTAAFEVRKASMSSAKISLAVGMKKYYTGSAVELAPDELVVKAGNVTLQRGVDYEIVGYKNNTKVGTATVTIRGINGYGGTKTFTFKINARRFSLWALFS